MSKYEHILEEENEHLKQTLAAYHRLQDENAQLQLYKETFRWLMNNVEKFEVNPECSHTIEADGRARCEMNGYARVLLYFNVRCFVTEEENINFIRDLYHACQKDEAE